MKENEEKLGSIASRKAKIKQRYKGINPDELDVIPALPQITFGNTDKEQRVAIYARVSTDDPRQTSSYELQKNHYQDVVNKHPGWKLIDIYADEGISGTSLQHRDSFVRMISDCKSGKIDLIITKSVSRFARNVLDCIGYVRQLAAMQPPIGVFFETENIFTLNNNSEMSLAFISTLAQEESHTKSEIMNASIEMRFKRGIFLTPPLLGYDQDEEGNLIINEEEAKTVRLIFFMYLYGYTCQEIANQLTTLCRTTKKGNTIWSSSSVLGVLRNERHCGDVLARKTWTPNYLDHKSKRNRQNRNQYRKKQHHEAIIHRDDFIAVQHLISNAKYGNKGFLPELIVITDGALYGYVSINPRWSGFKADDYRRASESICDGKANLPSTPLKVNPGDFDLRDFEIARGQFFNTANKVFMTVSSTTINFSAECIRKFDSLHIEMLIHPSNHMLAVRPATKDNRNCVQWSRKRHELTLPRQISGAAFLPNIYELFGWDTGRKYRILGVKRQQGDDVVILFNMNETEILIPNIVTQEDEENNDFSIPQFHNDMKPFCSRNNILAYPEEWTHSFGNNYYQQSQSKKFAAFNEYSHWAIQIKGQPYHSEQTLQVTNAEEIQHNITNLIDRMKQEITNEQRNEELRNEN